MSDCTYIFLDESRNFDFESPETRYFVMTSVGMYRPFPVCEALDSRKHDFLEDGLYIEYFHCSPDKTMFEKSSRLPLLDGVHKTAKGRDGYDRIKEPCVTSSAYFETEETTISARDY